MAASSKFVTDAIKFCIQVCRDGKGHQIQPELQSSIMLLVEHNFRHYAVVLRVTLKSRMLIFQHNVCIYPYSKRPHPTPTPTSQPPVCPPCYNAGFLPANQKRNSDYKPPPAYKHHHLPSLKMDFMIFM